MALFRQHCPKPGNATLPTRFFEACWAVSETPMRRRNVVHAGIDGDVDLLRHISMLLARRSTA